MNNNKHNSSFNIYNKKRILKLPIISKNLSRFFEKSQNKSNILEKFFDPEENLVNKLDLTSQEIPFSFLNNSLTIKEQLEKERIKKISEYNSIKSAQFLNEIDKLHLSERKQQKAISKIMTIEKENFMKNELNNIINLIEESKK